MILLNQIINCSTKGATLGKKPHSHGSKVVITWSRLAGMKLCPVFPRQSYKFFINYILRLFLKSFIPVKWDTSLLLPESRFAGTKFSHVIASARLGGMKKFIHDIQRRKSPYVISKDLVSWMVGNQELDARNYVFLKISDFFCIIFWWK